MYNRKINITESDRSQIMAMYYPHEPSFFDNYLTLDGRFYIKDDQLYDLHEQSELGSIFTIKNLKFLFENVKVQNSYIDDVKKLLNEITNEKFTIFEVKREILVRKSLLTEQEDEELANEPQTTQNNTTGSKIAGGVLWIARKVKSLLWSVGGMAVDAFLVASGIGKSVQWIPWAICLALDVYEWTSGDYGSDEDFKNATTFWKILTIGFDVLGMMTAGPVAKMAQKLFAPIKALKNEVQISQWIAKSPKAQEILTKMTSLTSGASGWLTKGAEMVSTKMPSLGKWLSSTAQTVGKAMGTVGSYIGKILSAPGRLAGKAGEAIQGTQVGSKIFGKYGTEGAKNLGAGTRTATNTAGLVGGIQKGAEYYAQYKTGLTPIQIRNMTTMDNVFKRYGNKDPFN